MTGEIFGVVAPVLLIAGIGYWAERARLGLHAETLSTLVLTVGTPALVFSALTSTELPDAALLRMSAGAAFVVLAGGLLAFAVLRLAGLPVRTFLPGLTMPNSGNIGLAVALLAFGDEGLAVGAAFFFVIALLQYTVTPVIVQGGFSLRATLRQPLIWSIAAVIAVKAADIRPPGVVADTTRILGGMMIPVMVILLGGALARLRLADAGLSVALAVVRLAIGVGAGLATVALLGVRGVEAGCLFLLASMPAAVVNYVFAERYGRAPERVAGLILASTLLTLAALPGLLWVALHLAASEGGCRAFWRRSSAEAAWRVARIAID